jgi:hypothetical protein
MHNSKLVAGKFILAAMAFVALGIWFVNPCRADDKVSVASVLGDMQKEEAKTRFMEGVELFFNEDYPGALASFQDS